MIVLIPAGAGVVHCGESLGSTEDHWRKAARTSGNENARSRVRFASFHRLQNFPEPLTISCSDLLFVLNSDMVYCGVYDNSLDNDNYNVAKGFNYHQGPVGQISSASL